MDTPYTIINNCPNWRVFLFSYPCKRFFGKFQSVSKFYGNFINGNQVLAQRTNREFFKDDIAGGFYFYYLTEEFNNIRFLFCFNYKFIENEAFITSNIRLRLKKILNCQVEVLIPSELDQKIKTFMKYSVGNQFQGFGNQFKKPPVTY
jgi:hypothetical protein